MTIWSLTSGSDMAVTELVRSAKRNKAKVNFILLDLVLR